MMAALVLCAGLVDAEKREFKAKLTGEAHRPPVVTATKGKFRIRFNEDKSAAQFVLRLKRGVAITAAHLHCSDTEVNGPVVAFLFGVVPGGFNVNRRLAKFTLTDDNIAALDPGCGITNLSDLRAAMEAGSVYVNVQSVANPSGEVRGQVTYDSKDTDGDGIRDKHDPDIDGDRIPNEEDPDPYRRRRFGSPPPAVPEVLFFYDSTEGTLHCNGMAQETIIPTSCKFNVSGELIITRDGWEGGIARLTTDHMISGSCRDSLTPNETPENSYGLTPICLPNDGGERQDATGDELVDEWLTDLPWHQKLSTLHSNLIDVPFVMPFDALPKEVCPSARTPEATATDKARCMLRYGIVNVMGMRRIDRPYLAGEAPESQDCQVTNQETTETDCVEVKVEVQRFHTLTDNPDGYEPDIIRNNPYSYVPQGQTETTRVPSRGFAITEATIFAPPLPWPTGHYCAVDEDNISDSVCYEDYFTTQLIAPANPSGNEFWLKDNPALFVPNGEEPDYKKFCRSGENSCSLYLGKVDWVKEATNPQIADCTKPDVCQEKCQAAIRECKTEVRANCPVEGECEEEVDENCTTDISNECRPEVIAQCQVDVNPAEVLEECRQEVLAKTDDLIRQFNFSIVRFPDVGRYPWDEKAKENLADAIPFNPFIGYYALKGRDFDRGKRLFKATHYVLPKQCTKTDFMNARNGDSEAIRTLKDCAVNFEIHTSGFHEIWKELYGGNVDNLNVEEIDRVLPGFAANQYGRTMFMLAGVPEQKTAVSFELLNDRLSIYDKTYGSSLYTQYLPMVNPADLTLKTKSYGNDFWHAFFMSNHMNQTPDHFIRGIRGRTLMHNEYRSAVMYKSVEKEGKDLGTPFEGKLGHVDFPAGFQVASHKSPFHGNTCDSCHVRNGSGIPLMPNGRLHESYKERGMNEDFDIPLAARDYTYTNTELPSMKMVLFDLKDSAAPLEQCDANDHTQPRTGTHSLDQFYTNKIMNFYGNSLHVNQQNNLPTYAMEYVPITDGDGSGFEVVDRTTRRPRESDTLYRPRRLSISNIVTRDDTYQRCEGIEPLDPDANVDGDAWPGSCADVTGDKILQAIAEGEIGFLHLNGRRLGNTPLIEMIPDKIITDTHGAQRDDETFKYPGCYGLAAGTRSGKDGAIHYRSCDTGLAPSENASSEDCYISRWGWIGDRASLEDQIANAAIVEMNITSEQSYDAVHPDASAQSQLVRYNQTLCGPADAKCKDKDRSAPNSDITEQEIRDIATYQRWIGIPPRSEYQVASSMVQEGERVFKEDLKCNSCHVIRKIPFVADDNMLPDEEREQLSGLQPPSNGQPDYPFVSYLGTDLLLHDMGYLSQVAAAPAGQQLRNSETGEVKDEYRSYVQKIRTPALKGLRFNRFVTDSNHNTDNPLQDADPQIAKIRADEVTPGCDFLLHDGRACDAIEAAFLHDGPAVKQMGMIEELKNLLPAKLKALRAFLYSL